MPNPHFNPNTRIEYRDKKNYEERLSEKSGYFWHYFENKARRRELHDRYKFHVSLDPKEFADVEDQVHTILNRAIKKGTIITYKTCDVMRHHRQHKEETDPNALRQLNNPFVVYLNDDQANNPEYLSEVTQLCKEIENVLTHCTPGVHRSISDLPLTPHIVFRQAILDGDVNPVKGRAEDVPYKLALGKEAEILREQGLKSVPYKRLKYNLRDFTPVDNLASRAAPSDQARDGKRLLEPDKPWMIHDSDNEATREKKNLMMELIEKVDFLENLYKEIAILDENQNEYHEPLNEVQKNLEKFLDTNPSREDIQYHINRFDNAIAQVQKEIEAFLKPGTKSQLTKANLSALKNENINSEQDENTGVIFHHRGIE